MSLIIRPSRLMVCGYCQKHAHIAYSQGTTSPEFAFQLHGLDILSDAARQYEMPYPESGTVRDQIRKSTLPENHLKVEMRLLWAIQRWNNMMHRMNAWQKHPDFHHMLRQSHSSRVPESFVTELDDFYNQGIHPENPIYHRLN